MAQKTVYLNNTGYTISDIVWDWCKKLEDSSVVATTGSTLTTRGEGWYILDNPNVVGDTDFKVHILGDTSIYAADVFTLPGDITVITEIPAYVVTAVNAYIASQTSTIISEIVDNILSDVGTAIDGSGFWTRKDVVRAINYVQREISRLTENIYATVTIEPLALATDIVIDSGGNFLRFDSVYRTYGETTRSIDFYTELQIRKYDTAWQTRTGSIIKALMTSMSAEGHARPYPIPDNADNDIIVNYIKLATKINADVIEAGDIYNQVSEWSLQGVNATNTDAGYILYYEIANVISTRTIKLYKSTNKISTNLVAQGSLSGNGKVTMTEQNNSGISGSVSVIYVTDDANIANTLSFLTAEIPEADIPCLEYGVKAMLYNLEKDAKDQGKGSFWKGLYGSVDQNGYLSGELAQVSSRAIARQSGTYSVMQERPSLEGERIDPLYSWEA